MQGQAKGGRGRAGQNRIPDQAEWAACHQRGLGTLVDVGTPRLVHRRLRQQRPKSLQAQPEVTVELRDGMRRVRARAAVGEERQRLWARFRSQREWGSDVDAFALRRPEETAVVVFEPQPEGS
jgi:hypothetical protein